MLSVGWKDEHLVDSTDSQSVGKMAMLLARLMVVRMEQLLVEWSVARKVDWSVALVEKSAEQMAAHWAD